MIISVLVWSKRWIDYTQYNKRITKTTDLLAEEVADDDDDDDCVWVL